MKPRLAKRGFNLAYLEILGALLVCAVVGGSIYSVFVREERSRQVGIELAEATQNARSGVDFLSRELRSAGYGVDPAVTPSILTASQYRVTFTLDQNGDHRIDAGETVTYFLDPNRGDPALPACKNPRDYVLRRKVSAPGDLLAEPAPGTGEIVAYGLTQRSASRARVPDVPLFSYRSAGGEGLELLPGTLKDPAGIFFGRTVSDADLGKPPSAGAKARVASIRVNMVTETKEKNPWSGAYDRVSMTALIEPRSEPPE